MKTCTLPALLALACLIAGCADARDESAADEAKAERGTGELEPGPAPSVSGDLAPAAATPKSAKPLGPGLQRLVDLATRDLSARLGITESSIEVIDAAYVTWRDSALGCTEPGNQYMQVLTNGSRIVLSVEKREYHYHSGANLPPFWCKNPDAIEPLPYAPGEA